MSHWLFRHLSFGSQKKEGFKKAFTLVELLLTIAIVGTLSAIAVPTYTNYIQKNNNNTAIVDINNIASQIEGFRALSGRPPNNFAEANIPAQNDPWGNSYQYLRIAGLPPGAWQGQCRRDRSLVPLNSDYDLYSSGPDGMSVAALTAARSWDDIIRANNGAYVGQASKY